MIKFFDALKPSLPFANPKHEPICRKCQYCKVGHTILCIISLAHDVNKTSQLNDKNFEIPTECPYKLEHTLETQ